MTPGKRKAPAMTGAEQAILGEPKKTPQPRGRIRGSSEMNSNTATPGQAVPYKSDPVPLNGVDIFEGLFEPEPFWFWHCLSGTPGNGLNQPSTWPEVRDLLLAEPAADPEWTMDRWKAEKARIREERAAVAEQFRPRFDAAKGLYPRTTPSGRRLKPSIRPPWHP